MDLGLSGRRALVLGASRGLGAAVARTLAAEGATVIAAARSIETTENWIAALADDQRRRLTAAKFDLAAIASIEALVDRLTAEGGIDILIGNSGGPPPCDARDTRRADWFAQFETMAVNLFHVVQLLLPGMVERGFGRILTIVSSGVEQPIPRLALSNGIRAAVVGWSKTLAAEVAHQGVTVNLVVPGRIHTERVDQLDDAAAARVGDTRDNVAKASAAAIPIGRYGRPEEFSDAVAFLVSARASYITGAKLRVDGGLIRGI